MNWEFLSEMIAELAAEHGRVMLPHLGVFVAEFAPASFSDKGFTIHPPYRRLVFRESQGDGTLLYESYSKKRGVSMGQAQYDVNEMVSTIIAQLSEDGVAELPNLGKFKRTLSGSILFVADEQLDVSSELMALDIISLKSQNIRKSTFNSNTKTASAPISAPVSVEPIAVQEASKTEEPATTAPEEPVTEASLSEPTETAPINEEPEELVEIIPGGTWGENLQEDEEDNERSKGWIVILVLFILVGLFFALFYVGVYFFPDVLDTFLYNENQLELLKYFEK